MKSDGQHLVKTSRRIQEKFVQCRQEGGALPLDQSALTVCSRGRPRPSTKESRGVADSTLCLFEEGDSPCERCNRCLAFSRTVDSSLEVFSRYVHFFGARLHLNIVYSSKCRRIPVLSSTSCTLDRWIKVEPSRMSSNYPCVKRDDVVYGLSKLCARVRRQRFDLILVCKDDAPPIIGELSLPKR